MKNKQIEALEKLIAVKDETIKELEKQIQLLKNQPPVMVPQFPEIPQTPINPWSQPITPGHSPLLRYSRSLGTVRHFRSVYHHFRYDCYYY